MGLASDFTLTPEQQAIVASYAGGNSLVVQAGAGTGKTSTLRQCALVRERRSATYIAYNRAIKDDAAAAFPRNVTCATAHSLAFRAVGQRYSDRLKGGRMPARMIAQVLGLRGVVEIPLEAGMLRLDPSRVARLVMGTTARFCQSADTIVDAAHVPELARIDTPEARDRLVSAIVPMARDAWADISRIDGRLPFSHDCYLKLWQLSGPRIPTDVVMLDEAQDANPVIASIVDAQVHAQRVLVGDSCQQLYAWRGAIDAMARFEADETLVLSQSFRFGPAVAAEANKWLDLLSAQLRLSGNPKLPSKIGPVAKPNAILCRTNAGVIAEAMRELELGRKVALVGGDQQIRGLAEAAIDLQSGRGTAHPDLMAFTTWAELQDYVRDDEAASDLKVFVDMIDDKGADVVLATCSRLVDEDRAEITVSTAHRSKGREWHAVRVAADFRAPKGDKEPRPDESMLAYVTVTRAIMQLERGGLSYVDDYVDEPAPAKASKAAKPSKAKGLRADLRSLLAVVVDKPQIVGDDSLDRARELERGGLVKLQPTADRLTLCVSTPAGEAEIGGRPS